MYQVIWDDDVYGEVASTWLDAKDRLAVIEQSARSTKF